MRKENPTVFPFTRNVNPGLLVLGVFCIGLLAMAPAAFAQMPAITLMGVAPDGTVTDISGTDYRWLVQLEKTYHVQTDGTGSAIPTDFDPTWDQLNDGIDGGETLSVGFHQSYMPVHAKGCAGGDLPWQAAAACSDLPFADPDGGVVNHYYVSVVPRSGYSIGGASFKDGDASVTVYVNEHPIETAQISILVFHDNAAINSAPDLPTEDPANDADGDGIPDNPMDGFKIIVEDAGGRYGASAGVASQDAFGNPLGTTYDALGNVTGYAPLITGPDGRLTIKNLAPGKYGIMAVPPAGQGWQQTSTIEGTKVIDAWVKAGEPPFFAEFGPPGFHAFIGFVKEFNEVPAGGGVTIEGTVVNQHLSRPPDYAFYNGGCFGHTTPWVGLNDVSAVPGTGVYAAPTDENCYFSIPNVPDGRYQLAVWDSNMDVVFGFYGLTIQDGECLTPGGSCNLVEVPVRQWFHRQEHRAFDDVNANGIWDDDEGPTALETGFALRWRDGTIYQENVSDGVGAFTFDQVFPFFSWLVSEVGFTRNQATGVTVVVDNGGFIPGSVYGPAPLDDHDLTFGRTIAPQDQTNPDDLDCTDPTVCSENTDYRVDLGPVLTYGVQGFLGQTNAFLWGKRHYPDGENGGISGIVFYAITRAENDPELAAAEVWEPGIPGVTVNLYENGGVDPVTGVAAKGALLNTTTTDSWDDSIPTGCKYGDETAPFAFSPDGTTFYDQDCYDGLRVFNQARPAVFDGGYAFDQICLDEDGLTGGCDMWSVAGQMPVGDYLVEMVPPDGYEILKPEDKNVDFGDEYQPAPELLPPPCVGPLAPVPDYLTLFPDEMIPAPFAGTERPLCDTKLVTLSAGANAAADFWAFTEVPVAAHGFGFILDDTQNEFDPNSPQFGEKFAPPFVPVTVRDFTGRVIGKTLSDQYGRYNFLAPSTITANLPMPSGMSPNMLTTCMNDPGDDPNEPDPNWNQQYSTFCYTFQYMPGVTTYLDTPVVPVAAFTGPDQFPLDCEYPDGTPRLYSVDVQTNGVGGGPYVPTYSVTTGNPANRGVFVDGEQTITITSMGTIPVQNPEYCNPAAGACPVGANTVNKFVDRDFGFGASGTVTLGDLGDITSWCTWGDPITCTIPADTYVGTVPAANTVGGRQLTVTRTNGQSTIAGVSVQVGLRPGASAVVVGPETPQALPPLDQTIQNAIDAAGPNDLIMVRPSVYNELVVMWKPVQLQGFGEGSTTINAVKAPFDKLQIWRDLVDGLIAGGNVDLLPGQEVAPGAPEPVTLWTEEGAGVLVLARASGSFAFDHQTLQGNNAQSNRGARIDGFTIKSADTGGGIIANGYARYLDISNNRIANNTGTYAGGIRIGHPYLTDPDELFYVDGENDFVNIHNNQVVFNGGLDGAGGGISMCTGADSYAIKSNWVCGNFSIGNGGGIGHIGVSTRVSSDVSMPLIAENTVIFNENFFQAQTVSGGGLYIGGAPPLTPGGLTTGAGDLNVFGNLFQGNSAGAGDGGGISLAGVNGQDVANNPDNDEPNNQNQPPQWYRVEISNNMIVNNVAGLAGGGLSLQDAVDVRIQDNTIANNDSVATAGDAFAPGFPNQSDPQPGAGVVSRVHSGALAATGATIGTFSDPTVFAQNIVWQNRQFYFFVDGSTGCTPGDPACTATYGLCPDLSGSATPLACPGGNTVVFDDLGVIGVAGTLTGLENLLTPAPWTAPGPTDPSTLFVAEYFNGARGAVTQNEITTAIQTPAAFDEGGNFIRPSHGPLSLFDDDGGLVCSAPLDSLGMACSVDSDCDSALGAGDGICDSPDGDPGTLFGDYHIITGSDAHDAATAGLDWDIDGDTRPLGGDYDIGADEAQVEGAKEDVVEQSEPATTTRRGGRRAGTGN